MDLYALMMIAVVASATLQVFRSHQPAAIRWVAAGLLGLSVFIFGASSAPPGSVLEEVSNVALGLVLSGTAMLLLVLLVNSPERRKPKE